MEKRLRKWLLYKWQWQKIHFPRKVTIFQSLFYSLTEKLQNIVSAILGRLGYKCHGRLPERETMT